MFQWLSGRLLHGVLAGGLKKGRNPFHTLQQYLSGPLNRGRIGMIMESF